MGCPKIQLSLLQGYPEKEAVIEYPESPICSGPFCVPCEFVADGSGGFDVRYTGDSIGGAPSGDQGAPDLGPASLAPGAQGKVTLKLWTVKLLAFWTVLDTGESSCWGVLVPLKCLMLPQTYP